VWSVNC